MIIVTDGTCELLRTSALLQSTFIARIEGVPNKRVVVHRREQRRDELAIHAVHDASVTGNHRVKVLKFRTPSALKLLKLTAER